MRGGLDSAGSHPANATPHTGIASDLWGPLVPTLKTAVVLARGVKAPRGRSPTTAAEKGELLELSFIPHLLSEFGDSQRPATLTVVVGHLAIYSKSS